MRIAISNQILSSAVFVRNTSIHHCDLCSKLANPRYSLIPKSDSALGIATSKNDEVTTWQLFQPLYDPVLRTVRLIRTANFPWPFIRRHEQILLYDLSSVRVGALCAMAGAKRLATLPPEDDRESFDCAGGPIQICIHPSVGCMPCAKHMDRP